MCRHVYFWLKSLVQNIWSVCNKPSLIPQVRKKFLVSVLRGHHLETSDWYNEKSEDCISVFYEIKRLNEKQNDISKTDRIRLTLLLSQRLQYKMRTLSPEDKETYNKLFGKKIRNESFTEGETMKYNELHQIVMNTPPIIND